MTNKLAKQLKDAGFPHKFFMCCEKKDHDCRADKPDCILSPSSVPDLSELIEACGYNFGLNRVPHGWYAYGGETIDGSYPFTEFGNTPEQAVTNLWLTLNKKDNETS